MRKIGRQGDSGSSKEKQVISNSEIHLFQQQYISVKQHFGLNGAIMMTKLHLIFTLFKVRRQSDLKVRLQ